MILYKKTDISRAFFVLERMLPPFVANPPRGKHLKAKRSTFT
jgi:hypothetical protein